MAKDVTSSAQVTRYRRQTEHPEAVAIRVGNIRNMQTGSGIVLQAHVRHLREVGIGIEEGMMCAICKCEEKDFHDWRM